MLARQERVNRTAQLHGGGVLLAVVPLGLQVIGQGRDLTFQRCNIYAVKGGKLALHVFQRCVQRVVAFLQFGEFRHGLVVLGDGFAQIRRLSFRDRDAEVGKNGLDVLHA